MYAIIFQILKYAAFALVIEEKDLNLCRRRHPCTGHENTSQYNGLYHVLGGVIFPIQGIGADELNIESLSNRVRNSTSGEKEEEVILALPATMEGDTTSFYITRKLRELHIKVSTIARGIPIGGELEYTDEVTLGRSILTRVNYSAD